MPPTHPENASEEENESFRLNSEESRVSNENDDIFDENYVEKNRKKSKKKKFLKKIFRNGDENLEESKLGLLSYDSKGENEENSTISDGKLEENSMESPDEILLENKKNSSEMDGNRRKIRIEEEEEEGIRPNVAALMRESEFLQMENEAKEMYRLSTKSEEKKIRGTDSGRVVRKFREFKVESGKLCPVYAPEQMRLISSIPEGFGTVPADETSLEEESFAAFSICLMGFFCIVPWFLGILYIRSHNEAARIAGISSLGLGIVVGFIVSIAWAFG
eukprot:TRINITY_DN6701_c0_g3_i1.p1 TRINITY_DN6701_c0_g3~~TRINITY_DN6701_c0_g3_i1.p1  ORF type:complete len:276 (-),score=99.68 TRINITY_DN6701_c0_g3_i1:41-868(-)